MANVKTAISIDKALYEQADDLAREMKTSRSHLFALALEEFMHHHQNRQLFDSINAAYSDTGDKTDQSLRRAMRRQQRQIVEGEW